MVLEGNMHTPCLGIRYPVEPAFSVSGGITARGRQRRAIQPALPRQNTVSIAEPNTVGIADPYTVGIAEPNTVSIAEPNTVGIAEPNSHTSAYASGGKTAHGWHTT